MKKFTSIAIAFVLALSVVPAMAADQTDDQVPATFQAFRNLPATEREALTPLTDKELAAIEGSFFGNVCIVCLNISTIVQENLLSQEAFNIFGFRNEAENEARQSNSVRVRQNIN